MVGRQKLVLFDLDGTLLNTLDDLGTACNHALCAQGIPTHPLSAYASFVGNGIRNLIRRAACVSLHTTEIDSHLEDLLLTDFKAYYNDHNCDRTYPYTGMVMVLQTLKQQGAILAVVSNKYQSATEHIVAHYFPNIFDYVEGEREGRERKPDPTLVRTITTQLPHISAYDTLLIGDSVVDIRTARNAGIKVAACCWGFTPEHTLQAASPDVLLHTPEEIIHFWHDGHLVF